eukprot:scaffold20504_cov47-Prasinocladus_malaysianus.AAC.1
MAESCNAVAALVEFKGSICGEDSTQYMVRKMLLNAAISKCNFSFQFCILVTCHHFTAIATNLSDTTNTVAFYDHHRYALSWGVTYAARLTIIEGAQDAVVDYDCLERAQAVFKAPYSLCYALSICRGYWSRARASFHFTSCHHVVCTFDASPPLMSSLSPALTSH